MKKSYETPSAKIVMFEVEDIITDSGLATSEGDNVINPDDGWW